MPPQEKLVVYRHLCREVEVFMPKHRIVEDIDLQNLLASGSVRRVVEDNWQDEKTLDAVEKTNVMIEDGGHLLYSKGVQTEFFTFILDGKAEVFSGRQKFRSEASRFTILCPELLSQTQHDHKDGLEFSAFVPDFTARVIENSRILRIPRENFLKCLLGKLRNYSRPIKETHEKMREINFRKNQSEMAFSVQSYDSGTNYTSAQFSNLKMPSFVKSSTINRSPRKRFYDDTYVGHENEGRNKVKLEQSASTPVVFAGKTSQHTVDIELGSTGDVQVLDVS